MQTSCRHVILAIFCLTMAATAQQNPLKAREKPIDPEGAFVPLDIREVANAQAPLKADGAEVQILHVPLNVAPEGDNHLFMKSIGWAAMENETGRDYPGFIALYDAFPEPDDATRAALRIPVADYLSVYVLAAADDDPALGNDLTLRFGRFGRNGRVDYTDFHVTVPRKSEKLRRGGTVAEVVPTEDGNLYLIRIPINRALAQNFQDYWQMHLDITTKVEIAVNKPDPYRYQRRPIAPPSGIRIYAMTLERSSMQMEVVSSEPGAVFNQPAQPSYTVITRNYYEHYREHHFEVDTVRDDGERQTFVFDVFRNWSPNLRAPKLSHELKLDLTARGHYEVNIRLMKGNALVVEHPTTLAILAPDTRKYRHLGPFGAWDFAGTHNTPEDSELRGSLAKKAGWRYMFKSDKYGLEAFNEPSLHHAKNLENLLKAAEENPDFKAPERALCFHETSISGPHVTRTPTLFTGQDYAFTEKEQERFDLLWEQALNIYATMNERIPSTEIQFGNGPPHLVEAFVKRGFPKEYLRVAANESGSFMRPPETQPTDFVANNAGIWIFRQILDHYGYQDTKLYQCYEITYPNTNPGNLTLRTQAAYYVRHLMHSLAWRVPKLTVGSLTDMGNSYYHSNWGGSGFCFGYPNVTPKPSYVSYAVLTQQLDGFSFVRYVPTGSTAVYAAEFAKRDGGFVTCLWTTRGERPVTIEVATPLFGGRQTRVVEMLGREQRIQLQSGKLSLTLSEEPLYLHAERPILAMELHDPIYQGPRIGEMPPVAVANPGDLDGWEIVEERDYELETFNFMQPRRQGDFDFEPLVTFAGRENVLKVSPRQVEGLAVQPMYASLVLKEAAEIPGVPTEIGAWVYGHGNWARLIFELEDADGERWISIGTEMDGEPNPWLADWMPKEEWERLRTGGKAGISDWNSNDAWGRSYANHDGWRFVSFVLPGHYGPERNLYHWPRNSQWRFSGDGKVAYPLKFKRLVITMREQVLYGTDMVSPIDPSIVLGGIRATYAPIEEAIE